jgi:hypothetical protein
LHTNIYQNKLPKKQEFGFLENFQSIFIIVNLVINFDIGFEAKDFTGGIIYFFKGAYVPKNNRARNHD